MLRNLRTYSKNTLQAVRCFSTNSVPDKPKRIQKNPTKEELQWRVPWSQQQNEFYSKLKAFAPEKPDNARIIQLLQTEIDLRPSAIRNWFKKRREFYVAIDQKCLPERINAVGNELAAAHFTVHRGGSIKFIGDVDWIQRDKKGIYDLPGHYDAKYIIEGIKCDGMPLNYEGLENFRGLRQIKSFSVNNCPFIDDWCVDRMSGQFSNTLEELDLRNCAKVTPRGLEALYRLTFLRVLKLTKRDSKEYELVCLLLEELFPKLNIIHE